VSERELPAPIAVVVGRNAEALRGGRKLDDVAKAVTAAGLSWGGGRISDLEGGRVVPRVETLLVLAAAFSDLLERPVTVADLLAGDGQVIVTPTVVTDMAMVRKALAGEDDVELPRPLTDEELIRKYATVPDVDAIAAIPAERRLLLFDIHRDYGEAEDRAARAFGVDRATLVEAMADTWGCSLSARRDMLAGEDATAQKRGIVTRALRAELRKALADVTPAPAAAEQSGCRRG
jgi:hypothetical protein